MTEFTAVQPTVLYGRIGAIACITLNRPHKLNAINAEMIVALHAALNAAETDPAVRVIMLNGAGRAFSAGFDLDAGSGDIDYWRAELQRDLDIIMRFWDCPKPTVAAVHGYCFGSAMEMALACDITFTAADCRFGAPEVKYGSGIACLILPWIIGIKQSKELLLSGDDTVDAGRALALGLVNRVVEPERLLAESLTFANRIAGNDVQAVRLTKQAINRTIDIMGLRAALAQAVELDAQIESADTPEIRRFNEILRSDGIKAAIAWRQSVQVPSR